MSTIGSGDARRTRIDLMSALFSYCFRYARRCDVVRRKKDDRESFLHFLQAMATHFMRTLLLLQTRKGQMFTVIFDIHANFFQNGLLFQDPYVAGCLQVNG